MECPGRVKKEARAISVGDVMRLEDALLKIACKLRDSIGGRKFRGLADMLNYTLRRLARLHRRYLPPVDEFRVKVALELEYRRGRERARMRVMMSDDGRVLILIM